MSAQDYHETMEEVRENIRDVSLSDGSGQGGGSGFQGGGGGTNIWLMSFSDIIALMLVFFVMLFAMSQPKDDVWTTMVQQAAQSAQIHGGTEGEEFSGPYGLTDMDRMRRQRALSTSYLYAVLLHLQENNEILQQVDFVSYQRETQIFLPYAALFSRDDPSVLTGEGRQIIALLTGTLGHLQNGMDVVIYGDAELLETKMRQTALVAEHFNRAGYRGRIRLIAHPADMPQIKMVVYSGR
ncbi:MAG: hypothetical protein EA357_01235 [Micavibrio sp.]|nr:MAG: hypothetical protein EA357_01235 [Micavibrio sp.]